MLDVSVVMPIFNGARFLSDQLASLQSQDFGGSWELLAVDNGSTDESTAVLQAFAGALPLRAMATSSPGKAHALNDALWGAKGRYLVFCDQDDVMTPSYLSEMVRALEAWAVAGGRLEHDALNPGWPKMFRDQVDGLPRLGPFVFSNGAALGARADVARDLGGFRSDVGVADDIDFCLRAQLAGHEVGWVPAAELHYRHRRTVRAAFKQAVGYAQGERRLAAKYPFMTPYIGRRRPLPAELRVIAALTVRARSLGPRLQAAHRAGRLVGLLAHR